MATGKRSTPIPSLPAIPSIVQHTAPFFLSGQTRKLVGQQALPLTPDTPFYAPVQIAILKVLLPTARSGLTKAIKAKTTETQGIRALPSALSGACLRLSQRFIGKTARTA